MKDHVGAYLARYAEPESAAIESVQGRYRNVLVLPMFDEPARCLERLLAKPLCDVLVVCVVNAPQSALGSAAHERCIATVGELGGEPDAVAAVDWRPGVGLLVIDRASTHLLPTRQGVGLARKIGADVALALIRAGAVAEPHIYSTDADVLLPDDYFANPRDSGSVAWSLPFRHFSREPSRHLAGQLFEAHLRHYREGLARAGSGYAHHSLGSTLCVEATAYAKVRGFPRRAAGEDFYLLNKLAKLGRISRPAATPIRIEARPSSRTPFGTGPTLARMPARPERFESFHPNAFEALAEALAQLRLGELAGSGRVAAALRDMGSAAAIERARRQYRTPSQYRHAIDAWFDGLRTLKFLHRMRDERWPDRPLLQTLQDHYGLATRDLDELNDAWCRRECNASAD